ncbi:MAG: peptide-N4-asparagine amidase [Betaproteobacteria bacterium]
MPDHPFSPKPKAFLPMAFALCVATLALGGCGGDESNPVKPGALVAVAAFASPVGASGVVVADATLPRPATAPCTIPLYSGMSYSGFDAHSFAYPGSGACPGKFAKVVLEADFSVNAGRQFDRTALISIGGVNLYFGTTQEPSATVAPSWHVERDLTDYANALTTAATGYVRLDNVVDTTYTGVLTGSAKLVFYPPATLADVATSRVADAVIPFAGDLTNGDPASLAKSSDVLQRTLTLPTNIVRLYLDVHAESQGGDEFWQTCVPDALASALQSCGGGSFREVLVTVDGQPAGLAAVVPRVYTGGIDPGLWRPTPGAETLAFIVSRVDLTPFAGALSDGAAHTVAISVEGAQDHFAVLGNLLVYRDPGALTTGGSVSSNTLTTAALTAPVTTNAVVVAADGSASGPVGVTASRSYAVTGYVDTSKGRVTTTVEQSLAFSNQQTFDITSTLYTQTVAQTSTVASTVTTTRGGSKTVDTVSLSYPLSLSYVYDGAANTQNSTVAQDFTNVVARLNDGNSVFSSSFENAINAQSGLVFSSTGGATQHVGEQGTQAVTYTDSLGSCYKRSIATSSNALASFTDGTGCTNGNVLNWLAQPDGAPAQGLLEQLSTH